jgi:hypothetical protein
MEASCRSVQTPPFTHLSLGAETQERPVRFRCTLLGKQPGRCALVFGVDGEAVCRLASSRSQTKIYLSRRPMVGLAN